ncbi:uncharacterized protein G2W53_024130 [Senna tora]|uniref:Uncharacterized protein n=1 Tax=Senna tora TaxID=362788 RepID=A0A834WCU5_9FABA|nr:uncharacterized protein G2W53_024130 [Senna tora]
MAKAKLSLVYQSRHKISFVPSGSHKGVNKLGLLLAVMQ